MGHHDWRPGTDQTMLEARASLLRQVREFFFQGQVLEVDTPVLSAASGTDPALDPLRASLQTTGNTPRDYFLQTSPEFAMKRLLAAGSGPIYQLAKSFRNAETGRHHNPEFTMLEWYRPGFSMAQLMDEVEALVSQVLGTGKVRRISYNDLFQEVLGISPLAASLNEVKALTVEKIDTGMVSMDSNDWLDLLFSHCIQPQCQDPVFITHYPPAQAALARVEKDEQGRQVAMRFELVVGGLEIANGYLELTDPVEQKKRFHADLVRRRALGLPEYPMDERLLGALAHGLPDCAGVALGLDRLLMLLTGADTINQVLAFPVDIA